MTRDGNDRQTRTLTGCFVNINTEDFGIELDRIARITINDRVVRCDGEVTGYRALNRAVGLFEVGRLQSSLASGGTEFVPDFVYLGGVRFQGDKRIQQYVRRDLPREIRKWRSKQDVDRFVSTTAKLDLCPVTRSIVRRHIESGRRVMPNPAAYDVFISYEHSDRRLAQRLYAALRAKRLRVFLAPENREEGTFLHRIQQALASTRAFVAVASRGDTFTRGWPEWELEAFTMAHGTSPNAARIVNFVEGVEPLALRLLLKGHDVVDCKSVRYKAAVDRLVRLL